MTNPPRKNRNINWQNPNVPTPRETAKIDWKNTQSTPPSIPPIALPPRNNVAIDWKWEGTFPAGKRISQFQPIYIDKIENPFRL